MGCVLESMVGRLWFGEQEGGDLVQEKQVKELVKLGFNYYSSGKDKEAIDYFKQALKVSERADIYNNLGMVYLRKGDYSKAVNTYRKALSVDKGYIPAYYNLGITLYYARNYDDAIKIFSDVLKIKGLDVSLLAHANNEKGCAQNRKDDIEAAKKSFEAALVLNDKFIMPYVNLGNIYCNKGEFDTAKAQYNKAIELDDKCAAAYNGLGVIAIEDGDFKKAEELFDKALVLDNRCEAAYINKVLLKRKLEAKAQIASALRDEPSGSPQDDRGKAEEAKKAEDKKEEKK